MLKFLNLIMVCCLILAAAPAMAAETDETGRERGMLAFNFDLTVKPGEEMQFEEALKKQVAFYTENKDQWSWHTWQWVTGHEFGQYVFRSPGHHWADMDARGDLATKAYAHYLEVVRPHLKKASASIEMYLKDISQWSDDYGDVPFVSVHSFHIKYGKSKEFHNVLKRIHRTVTEGAWPENFAWITPVSGEKMPLYVLVIPHKNWADMDEPEVTFWQMVEDTAGRGEADSIREALIGCVEKQVSALAKFRPDLSYTPAE